MVTLTINKQQINVPKGTTILNAAKSIGIEIPTLCYHKELSIAGNCRICQVELLNSGRPAPHMVASCHTVVQDGMEIDTNSSAVQKARKIVMEMIFLNHPVDCPVCDQAGECVLHQYYIKYATYNRRAMVTPVKKTKMKQIGRHVMLDSERCILCARCVRFTDEITKTHELAFFQRGNQTELNIIKNNPLNNPYSLCVVDLCPVGALTSIPFRFKKRVWLLKQSPSICTGCARGCNIYLEHDDQNKIYRVTPRENPDVNKTWLCDAGRISYINPPKLLVNARHRQQKITTPNAIDEVIKLIKQHQKISVVISANTLFENAFMIRYFCYEYLDINRFYLIQKPDGVGDDLLITEDRSPNKIGVTLAIGKHLKNESPLKAFRPGELVLYFGGEPCNETEQIIKKTERSTLVLFTQFENEFTDIATVALPVQSYLHQNGFLINCNHRLQYAPPLPEVSKQFIPSADGVIPSPQQEEPKPIYQIIAIIAQKMGFALNIKNQEDVMNLIHQEYPQFKDVHYNTFPPEGIPLNREEL